MGLVSLASWAVLVVSILRVLSGCLVQEPICYFSNPFLGTVRGGTRVCGFPDLVECPRCRLLPHVFDSAGSAGVVFSLTRVMVEFCFRLLEFLLLWLLFEFITYLTGLNSNPSRFLDPWVAARPSGVPGRGPGGRVITAEVMKNVQGNVVKSPERTKVGAWEKVEGESHH
ncbi:hypothetical protein Taro_007711 [Colocasia esculenta]|uniref:Uncharacterized protein n=1 Tax=Colocasia esculenta TaxID=4460 RepID=A0A843TYY7_COLES|nr:hypothetical protein [Colocasia esculenta]